MSSSRWGKSPFVGDDIPLPTSLQDANLADKMIDNLDKTSEVELYTTEEGLSELDRYLHVLEHGHTVQQSSVLSNAAVLYALEGEDACATFLSFACEHVSMNPNMTAEKHVAFASGVRECLERYPNIPSEKMAPVARVAISMIESPIPQVCRVYSDLLVALCRTTLSVQYLIDTIIPFINSRSGLAFKGRMRILVADLLFAVALRLPLQDMTSLLLPLLSSLCQDIDYQVRCSMARRLGSLASKFGVNLTEEHLLNELLELLQDEELCVKEAALEQMVEILDFVSRDTKRNVLLPIFIKIATTSPTDIRETFSKVLGPLLWRMSSSSNILTDENMLIFLDCLKTLSSHGDQVVRSNLAYNFASFVKVFGTRRYVQHLYSIHESLAFDADPSVRRPIAACLHEVGRILGSEKAEDLVKPMYCRILEDVDDDIINLVVLHLGDFAHVLCSKPGQSFSGSESGHMIVPESVSPRSVFHLNDVPSMAILLGPSKLDMSSSCYSSFSATSSGLLDSSDSLLLHLLEYGDRVRAVWRKLLSVVDCLGTFCSCVTSDAMTERIIPFLFKLIPSSPLPVQSSALIALVQYMRSRRIGYRRLEICQKMVDDFGGSKSQSLRIKFIDMCHVVFRFFSRKFFRQHCISAALALAKDPVANVRIALCRLLPVLKVVLKPPSDVTVAAKLNESLAHLLLDRDQDVVESARKAQSSMSDLDNEFSRESRYGIRSEEDEEDRRREEEEKDIFADDEVAVRSLSRGRDRKSSRPSGLTLGGKIGNKSAKRASSTGSKRESRTSSTSSLVSSPSNSTSVVSSVSASTSSSQNSRTGNSLNPRSGVVSNSRSTASSSSSATRVSTVLSSGGRRASVNPASGLVHSGSSDSSSSSVASISISRSHSSGAVGPKRRPLESRISK